jgi:two-component system nitrogen regulation response regulator GlnG
MPTLLVIDDETTILDCFRFLFTEEEAKVVTAASATEGLQVLAKQKPDVVVIDVRLPDTSGLELFRKIHERDAKLPVIFITGHGTAGTAIEAMRLGAFEYVVKPLDPDQLRDMIGRAFEISRLMRVPAKVADAGQADDSSDILVGQCPGMQEVYKAIGRVAPQDVTVLILGESGTGKELVARAIYHYSSRSQKPFLAMNCAAIPETLLESELFGHEKGSFTGAERKRIGKFEQCEGGTLFLDEIGDMTPLTQTKILRVLQEKQFERVGGNEVIATDVRIIAATNRDLAQFIDEGKFRRDLFYRLNVYAIKIPPLRERGEDMPLLVDHYLKRYSKELGKEVAQLAPEALGLLQRYSWPGNVRELQSVLKQAILQASGPVLLPEFLPPALRGTADTAPPFAAAGNDGIAEQDLTRFIHDRLQAQSTDLFAEFHALTERHLFVQVLRHTGGNQSQAARILGITRNTMRAKLAALGLSIERTTSLEEEAAKD